jgi:hypothetical protein
VVLVVIALSNVGLVKRLAVQRHWQDLLLVTISLINIAIFGVLLIPEQVRACPTVVARCVVCLETLVVPTHGSPQLSHNPQDEVAIATGRNAEGLSEVLQQIREQHMLLLANFSVIVLLQLLPRASASPATSVPVKSKSS